MTPDDDQSPPSLEDQVHAAYALDNIHLAKILLLRLKGINVTDDNDPRIAAVQDEDFDFCFIPNGRLLDDRDEKMIQDMQAQELHRLEGLRRLERLKACEHKFALEKRRMREEKATMLQSRSEELRRRQKFEEERRRTASDDRRRALKATETRRSGSRADRRIVNYDHLSEQSHSKSDRDQHFVYDFMTPVPSVRPHSHHIPSRSPPTATRQLFPSPIIDDSASIPFTDVLKSMNGPLFPLSNEELIQQRNTSPVHTTSRSRTQSQPRQRSLKLLSVLLAEGEHSAEQRRNLRGKQRAPPRPTKSCLACSASTSPPSSPSSSSSVSRTSSWLSFRSNHSASSSSTDLTTPSTSPVSSWFSSRPKSWIAGSTMTEPPLPLALSPPPILRHSCKSHNRLSRIPTQDGPLVTEAPSIATSTPISDRYREQSTTSVKTSKEDTLASRMTRFVELAKGLHTAYVTAARLSISVSYDSFDDRHSSFYFSEERDRVRRPATVTVNPRPKLRPAGSRATVQDVALFLNTTSVSPQSSGNEQHDDSAHPARYIQLTCPFPPSGDPPRTALASPLPYTLHFKPIPAPIQSAFRFHAVSEQHTMYPLNDHSSSTHGSLSWRIRSVGNPAYLRLKALQNVVWRAGMRWEGCGRDTALGGGRERVVGVAFEGVGRSLLSRYAAGGQ